MVKRKYSGRTDRYPRYKKGRFSRAPRRRGRYSRAASTIQRLVRSRRARKSLAMRRKNYSIKKFNRQSSETVYKSFTILCPDYLIINPGTGVYANSGLACTDTTNSTYQQCFELGMLLKDPGATNGVSTFSTEMSNYLELFKQCRIVHGSASLLKWSDGDGDGTPITLAAGASSIGRQGNKNWVSYIHSVIDTGAFKAIDQLQDLAVPPSSNIASVNPNDYFANSNSRFKQLSWDSKKSIKTKVLAPTRREEWAAQYYGFFNTATPPAAVSQLRCNSPWVDTSWVENCIKNNYPAGHPNYKSCYALTRLPPVSFLGTNFPSRTVATAGLPVTAQTPIHKCLVSICVAFRIPTVRN